MIALTKFMLFSSVGGKTACVCKTQELEAVGHNVFSIQEKQSYSLLAFSFVQSMTKELSTQNDAAHLH